MGNRLQIYKITNVLLLLFLFCFCERENNCFEGVGEVVNEVRYLDSFEKLILEDNVNIILLNDSIICWTYCLPRGLIWMSELS